MDRTRRQQSQCSGLGIPNSTLHARYFAVLMIALCAISGCTTTALFSKFTHKQKFPKATAENPAVRCLCLWEPSEGTGVDNKPARGVSGQIFFFTRGGASSVEVEGDVRVFLFDDQGAAEAQAQPLHQFDFLSGSWQAHVTSTQFGPAYQLFVPYSRKGHHQAELAIRVRLTPPSGSPLYSEIAKVTLPGYERARPKEETEVYEPEASRSALSNNVARNDRVTPDSIGETLLQVMAERRSSEPATDFATSRSSVADGPARRTTRRNMNPDDVEPSDGDEPRIRRPRRHIPEPLDEADSNHEE